MQGFLWSCFISSLLLWVFFFNGAWLEESKKKKKKSAHLNLQRKLGVPRAGRVTVHT